MKEPFFGNRTGGKEDYKNLETNSSKKITFTTNVTVDVSSALRQQATINNTKKCDKNSKKKHFGSFCFVNIL